ncbi:MAG TPA: hypothetical protein ENI23_09890 [bacterium]|nr:hypothetical protein [bacterium]
MSYQHKQQSQGEWAKKPFLEQVANIGSEVERTISWSEKGNQEYSNKAFIRSLELFDLTLNSLTNYSQIKEIARMRETWVDFIKYSNIYKSTAKQFRDYFMQLLFAYKLLG